MKSIAAGAYHNIAILEDNTMEQWGDDENHQYDNFPEDIRVKAVSAGLFHSVALAENGSIVQWGKQPRGPPKPRGTVSIKGLKLKQISCGPNHTVGLTEDGTVVQWGSESSGQAQFFPPKSFKATMVSAGYAHNVAIQTSGRIYEWGATSMDIKMNIHNPPMDKVKYVSSGSYHSVAIREDGTLLQWILVDQGQGAGMPTEGVYKTVSCGAAHTVAIKEDGTIVQWGDTSNGQMKDFPPADTKFVAVACGMRHSIGITEDGTVIQWGAEDHNQSENMPDFVTQTSNMNVDGGSPLERLENAYEDTPDPNPYPELANKITGDLLPTGPFSYNKNTTAFNATMYQNVSLENSVKNEGNPLIVKVGGNYSLIDRDYIKDTIKDFSGIRYACTKVLSLAVYPKNVYGKNPLYYMKGLAGGSNFLVVLSEIQAVLDRDVKAIELVPGTQLAAISSFSTVYDNGDYNFLGKLVDAFAKDHCQAGTQQMLYRIKVLQEPAVGGKRKRAKTHKKSSRKRKATRKSRA